MFCPLGDAENGATRCLEYLAGSCEYLPRDKEWNEMLLILVWLSTSSREIVLMTTVRVAGRIGVVLEQINGSADSLFFETLFRTNKQLFEFALSRLVMHGAVID